MKRHFPALVALVIGLAAGFLVGSRPDRAGGAPGGGLPTEFMVDRPDPTDPTGRTLTEYRVYRVTSADRGILFGTADPPPADGPKPMIVTFQGRERVAYYGLPKPTAR